MNKIYNNLGLKKRNKYLVWDGIPDDAMTDFLI